MKVTKTITNSEGYVDPTTGELITCTFSSNKQTFTKTTSCDNFVQLYIRDLADIYRIRSRTQIALLITLCEETHLITSKSIELPTFTALLDDKIRWAQKLEVTPGKNIDNALAGLVSRGIILRVSRGKYAINPKYVFAGALANREKTIELSIKYNLEA